MTLIKYMSWITTLSVFTALISIIYQAFLLLKQLNKVTNLLTGILAIEASYRRSTIEPKAKVALGYGACSDLVISATEFLNFSLANVHKIGPEFTVDEINDEEELIQTFAYYFQNGAAAERNMPNSRLFHELITKAKTLHRDNIKWFIGGNAPLMGIRFHLEGADVLLGARMSYKLRRLVPPTIRIAGEEIAEDDIHLILEYKAGDTWGTLTAPRANRYILHNDQNNPHVNALEDFDSQLRYFTPHLLVVSGLQMMDSHKFEPGVRNGRLWKVQEQITSQPASTLIHFEMASYVELELLLALQSHVLPFVDSIGMNEQELENLRNILEYQRTTLASHWNPRIATTLDHMRYVFKTLAAQYFSSAANSVNATQKKRLLTRIHVHTLAYQAFLVVRDKAWKQTRVAAAKASLTAHRYVCQTDMINPESANLILDESFATSSESSTADRIHLRASDPVPCWNETLIITANKAIEIEICVAPVLVCRVARKTAGAGDNISAAALSQQI